MEPYLNSLDNKHQNAGYFNHEENKHSIRGPAEGQENHTKSLATESTYFAGEIDKAKASYDYQGSLYNMMGHA